MDILAQAERDLVAFMEAYFDESGSHDGSPVLCIAGYLYDKDSAARLDQKWAAVLQKYSLPYLRMSAFAPGNPPFDKLTYQERVDAGKEFIDLVRDHMTVGWSFTLCEGEFDAYMSGAALFGSAYSWACLMSLTGVHQWIEETGFDGKIAYFFEAGHKYQKQANWVMNQIYSGAYMRKKFRYAAHSFVDKQIVRPIQSADMLAWHQAKWIKDKYILGRETLRKDFKYLTERDTFTNHHSSKNYIAFHKHVLNPSPDQVEEILRDLLEQ